MKAATKFITFILSAALILGSQAIPANASLSLIKQISTKETVTSGATLERISRFTNDGWLSINLLRVNITNPYVKLDVLQNNDCLRTLTSTINLAKKNKAIAAVNASFFLYGKKSEPGTGTPIGPIIRSGVMQSIDISVNDGDSQFATISVTKLNKILYNYWKTTMTFTGPNETQIPIARFNKPYYGHTDYTVIDSKYRTMSYGTTYSSSDICELVVDNGIIKEIRNRKAAVEIPKTGYVVITRTAGSQYFLNNFKVGDAVSFNIVTTPKWNDINMAVSGGAMLIKNGKIPTYFSHSANGGSREARTAIGSTKDGKTIFMITVDDHGRQSIGMTQKELASYMLSKGAYNALNFDGGGSTTLVSRLQENGLLQEINMPKQDSERSVVNAVGLFSTAPASEPAAMKIFSSDKNVFVNTSRTFNVKFFDKYMNPVKADDSKVVWSVSGIKGTVKEGVLRPTSVGSGKITATYGGFSASAEVNSLSSPVQLILNSKAFSVAPSKTKQLSIVGKNRYGYSGKISVYDVKWSSSSSSTGTVANGLFKGLKAGKTIIDAYVGKTHTYALATVQGTDPSTLKLVCPKDTPIKDYEKKYVSYKKGSSSVIFSVFGNVAGLAGTTEKALASKLVKTVNSSYDFGGFLTTAKSPYQSTIKKPAVFTDCGYKSVDVRNCRFIQLDACKGGLRLSKSGQWTWLMNKVNANQKTHLFIFLSRAASNFTDSAEGKLLRDLLTDYRQKTGRNVWVFYRGSKNSSIMERGVKYISTGGFSVSGFSSRNKSAAKYALVKVMGKSATYGFKSI